MSFRTRLALVAAAAVGIAVVVASIVVYIVVHNELLGEVDRALTARTRDRQWTAAGGSVTDTSTSAERRRAS